MTPKKPKLVRTKAELDQALADGSRTVVMTMGALHQGHLDLVDRATQTGGQVIVTLFVNPLQFGPEEDFDSYPRTIEADLAELAASGVTLVYAPAEQDMYPDGKPQVTIRAGSMGQDFEGAARPGHFDGVLTVVHKMLQRTGAMTAVFGQKDAQQLALVKRMVADLDLGVQVLSVPTRREADGLAMSSRNSQLDPIERQIALALPRAIEAGVAAAVNHQPVTAIRAAARRGLGTLRSDTTLDYLEVVHPDTFTPFSDHDSGPALVIGALRIGQTRLIDNAPIWVDPGD